MVGVHGWPKVTRSRASQCLWPEGQQSPGEPPMRAGEGAVRTAQESRNSSRASAAGSGDLRSPAPSGQPLTGPAGWGFLMGSKSTTQASRAALHGGPPPVPPWGLRRQWADVMSWLRRGLLPSHPSVTC